MPGPVLGAGHRDLDQACGRHWRGVSIPDRGGGCILEGFPGEVRLELRFEEREQVGEEKRKCVPGGGNGT